MSAASDNDRYVYSPVLNFIQVNFEAGIDDDIIVSHAVDFFENSAVSTAKIELYSATVPDDCCPKRVGNKAITNNIRDMIDLIRKCDSENITIPIYVIRLPTEVPTIPAVAYSRFATKINNIGRTLEVIDSKLTNYDMNFPALPTVPANDNLATVVISNVPKVLNNPAKRREVIDKISGHEAISSIRSSNDKLVVRIDNVAVNDFCKAVPSVLANSKAKLIEKKYFGLLKGIGTDYDISRLTKYPGVSDVTRLGTSHALRISFVDVATKINAIKNGLKVDYEFLRVFEYFQIPRCCHRCRSPDHVVANCRSPVVKCSRCSDPHESSKDSPCQLSPKCANCGGDHVSYSLRCPKLRAIATKGIAK